MAQRFLFSGPLYLFIYFYLFRCVCIRKSIIALNESIIDLSPAHTTTKFVLPKMYGMVKAANVKEITFWLTIKIYSILWMQIIKRSFILT